MGYTVNGIKYDYDSRTNQEIKRKLVARDVYCNVNSMVEYILSKFGEDRDAPFGYEDITNFFKPCCPKCGSSDGFEAIFTAYKCECCGDFISEENFKICPKCKDDDSTEEDYDEAIEEISEAYKCENCEHIVEDVHELEHEEETIYEWWMVSDWLARQLANKGECVLLDEGIWGRGCTGQAILLDYVISQICYDMEILEGQKYEWSVI